MEKVKLLRITPKTHKRLKEYTKKNMYQLSGFTDKLINDKLDELDKVSK